MQSEIFFAFVFVTGATVWALSLTGKWLKGYVSPPLVALAAGVAFRLVAGPVPGGLAMTLLGIASWMAVSFGVVSVALRFRSRDLRALLPRGSVIILLGLLGMFASTTAIVALVFGLPLLPAAVVAAILTPTDPVVASSIVTGPFAERHIPERIRHMLSFESAGNDGLGLALLFLPILLLAEGSDGWKTWLLDVDLWQIGGGGILGLGLGYGLARALQAAQSRRQIGRRSLMLASLTATVGLVGLAKLVGMDSIWAAFLAGLVVAVMIGRDLREASFQYQEGGNNLAMVPTMILFPFCVPWQAWGTMIVPGLAATALILVLRRIPTMALLYLLLGRGFARGGRARAERDDDTVDGQPFRSPRDLWYYGWFGPIGFSAIYYAGVATRELGRPEIWPIASLTTALSIVAFGLTAAPFTRLYAARSVRRA